ncbi:MAG: hypothetical protein HYU04_00735 [Candidatus Wildermuthbacteria bacterium]|nr:hypothetical protein [Candidatus Wildermuthbacteria bacterium]
MKPLRKKNIKWSSPLAYTVGLITTDGNLSPDGRHIIFVSKDKEQIVTFKRCLEIDNKISRKRGGFTGKKDYYVVQFGDIILYRWLLGIGLTPNKSRTIGALKVPDRYFFDFLRGHFDGDGSCFSYWDPRWKSSFMFYVTFNSASLTHIEWLRKTLHRLVGVTGHVCNDGRKIIWQLKYAKRESKIIIKRLYGRRNTPRLMRKYRKIRKILATDK